LRIHPTAVVDPGAELGRNVEIGAYAVIGPDVVIGDDTIVQSHAVIEGAVQIGKGNVIGYGAIIGARPQDLSFKAETRSGVVIGDRNVVREYCTIHRGTAEGSETSIGNDNFFMVGVHLGHNCRIANRVIIANNCLLGGYVQIEEGAFVGGATTFHQFVRVGRLVMAQGSCGFSKDIPPFVLAGERKFALGVNVVGLRRAGVTAVERDEIRRAFKLLYRSGLNTQQALAKAGEMEFGGLAREFFDFVAQAKKRGVVAYRYATGEDAAYDD
jgi:UDP-N-acetylglucosamine acyltransferase